MAGKTIEARIEMYEQKLAALKEKKQKPRLQVAVAVMTRRELDPIFHGRKGGEMIVREAEKLTLLQAVRYLSLEDNSVKNIDATNGKRGQPPTVVVSPSSALLERAERFYASPHVFIRAASVKIARRLKWMRERGKELEYIEQLNAPEPEYRDDEAEDTKETSKRLEAHLEASHVPNPTILSRA